MPTIPRCAAAPLTSPEVRLIAQPGLAVAQQEGRGPALDAHGGDKVQYAGVPRCSKHLQDAGCEPPLLNDPLEGGAWQGVDVLRRCLHGKERNLKGRYGISTPR